MADTARAAATRATGQPHDRLRRDPDSVALKNMSNPLNDPDDPPEDVSISQKMLSAVTGSILTSLLGTCLSPPPPPHHLLTRPQQPRSTSSACASSRNILPLLPLPLPLAGPSLPFRPCSSTMPSSPIFRPTSVSPPAVARSFG